MGTQRKSKKTSFRERESTADSLTRQIERAVAEAIAEYVGGDRIVRRLVRGLLHPQLDTVARIVASIEVTDDGCWRWRGGRTGRGHPAVRNPWLDRTDLASRTLFRLLVGRELRSDEYIRHDCRDRSCVRHLRRQRVRLQQQQQKAS